ncbi:MAG: type I restriction enzyme HsdR N-terminal domain-containing protein [Bacteroidota bacterium]
MFLPALNFPPINARYQKNDAGVLQVFDIVRKKFVVLSPEEWVRQHLIHYITQHKNVPLSMVAVEKQLILNNTKRRTDVVIYNSALQPLVIVECKAPSVILDQKAINQSLRYNLILNVPFIFLSNGNTHICVKMNEQNPQILTEFPDYKIITDSL